MNKFVLLLLVVFMVSCKSKAVVAAASKDANRMTADKIIENHYNNKNNFSTLYIKANARYSDDKQTQNVTAEIKIKKDEQILISIRFLGITMAKALITPTAVSYYEKVNGSYFEGDFRGLSQWLGTDLDYNKIQNMLLGEAFDDLSKGKYNESFAEQTYRLDDFSNNNVRKSFFLDAATFLIQKQEITQIAEDRMIQVAYSESKMYNELVVPMNVLINTSQQKGKTEINLNYNTVSFNEQLSFPYSIPNGYKRILIK
ncbi:hypothetical protein D3C86_944660 [compost metagenome]